MLPISSCTRSFTSRPAWSQPDVCLPDALIRRLLTLASNHSNWLSWMFAEGYVMGWTVSWLGALRGSPPSGSGGACAPSPACTKEGWADGCPDSLEQAAYPERAVRVSQSRVHES